MLGPACCRVRPEWRRTHRHLVGNDANLVEVGEGAVVAPAGVELFGGHVDWGSDHALRTLCHAPALAVRGPGNSEVAQPQRLPLGGRYAEEIRRLDIAVQHAPRMGMSNGGEQLPEQRREPSPGQGEADTEE